jgi:hypothetical protein
MNQFLRGLLKKLAVCIFFTALPAVAFSQNARLKYIIYDFDGLNMGQTDLPDGDFKSGDLAYSIDANPLTPSDVLGDRVLRLNLSWNSGAGEFGKAASRFLELSSTADQLNFYFYNPTYNSGSAQVQVSITEDDNGNNTFEGASDDKWIFNTSISTSGGWQLISVPLSSMQDGNSGGNGLFDASYTGAAGKLFSVAFTFTKPTSGSTSEQYYIDMICFTEGGMPQGSTPLELPPGDPSRLCKLGALGGSASPDQVPDEIQSFLPANKRLSFVNWFQYYSKSGTVANSFPGPEVQNLIDADVTPIITWESMYSGYSRLNSVQPRLDEIINGSLDGYIDAFANKIKSYSGNVIIRILHEFEGDWYPWSLNENNKDPAKYISAFRHIVDRFRSAGANNVKWMWCLNAEPKPYAIFNYVVSCYPGDNYVDIVATDIYNHPDLGTPDWKSFRYTMAESYYYLEKHYSHKPIYVCEVGCRERDASEPSGSQSKADWTCMMNKDLKTYFKRVEALVFFSLVKEHDWRINSSGSAEYAFENCIWNDSYYYGPVGVREKEGTLQLSIFPNPFNNEIHLIPGNLNDSGQISITITDVSGKILFSWQGNRMPSLIEPGELAEGVYLLHIVSSGQHIRQKIVRLHKG